MSSSEHAELVNVFLIACFILAHVLSYCRLISGIGAKSAAAMGDLLDEGLTDLDGAPLRLVARGGGHVARAGGVAVQYGGCGAVQTFQRASRNPRMGRWWCSCSKVEEASSPHYVVIKDQIGFHADDLEQFTLKLCYLFNRATKAVSICPPAYYADLLCERGRAYLYSVLQEDNRSTQSDAQPRQLPWTRDVHRRLQETTFYI